MNNTEMVERISIQDFLLRLRQLYSLASLNIF